MPNITNPKNMPRIILASKSRARTKMLQDVGLKYDSIPANIDEQNFFHDDPEKCARQVSSAKALHISNENPDALVLGSDQVLYFENNILTKARDKDEAVQKIKNLNGKTHRLYSGISVACNNKIIWSNVDHVDLTMHNHDENFINHYANCAGDTLTQCVGAYAYEEHGAWLFERVEGNYFTILGMPLLPLLHELKMNHGVIPCQK